MGDLISRQAALKNAHFPMIDDAGYEVVRVDDILALPSAEPKTKCIAQIRIDRDDLEDLVNKKVNEIVDKMAKPKTGKWTEIENGEYLCNNCLHITIGYPPSNCPNCGSFNGR